MLNKKIIVSFETTICVDVEKAPNPDEYALHEAKRLISQKLVNEGSKMFNYLIEE
jgi:hypothetical protein